MDILNKEFHTFIKTFKPADTLKNDDLTKRLLSALESDLKDEFRMMNKNIVDNIPNALSYYQQNPDLLSKGIVKLKKNKHFVIESFRVVDEPIVYNTRKSLVRSQSALISV